MIAKLAVLLAFFFFQEADPNVHCDNAYDTPAAHKCAYDVTKCHRPGEKRQEDKKCKAYCYKEHCHCVSECST